jgi:heme exporter protein D
MTKKNSNDERPGQEKTANPIRLKDFILATSLIILASLAGISLFVFIIIMVNQNDAIRDFFSTNPEGTEISNRAMGVGFALAGAFASTVIAFAALTAQSTANRSQQALQKIEQQRIAEISAREKVEARRRDFQRHAQLIAAINHVIGDASAIVEDMMEIMSGAFVEVAEHRERLETRQRGSSREERQSFEDNISEVMEQLVHRHAPLMARRHAEFWAAIGSMAAVEQKDLMLDQLWMHRFSDKTQPGLLNDLSRRTGIFGVRSADAVLPPSEFSHRIMKMSPDRAKRIMALCCAATVDAICDEIVDRIEQHLPADNKKSYRAEYTKIRKRFADFDLDFIAEFETTFDGFQIKLEEYSGLIAGLRDDGFPDEDEAPELPEHDLEKLGYIRDKLDELQEELANLIRQAKGTKEDLGAFYNDNSMTVREQSEKLGGAAVFLLDALDSVLPAMRGGILTRRHQPDQTTNAEAALLRHVIGAIVMPDAALLALETDMPKRDDAPGADRDAPRAAPIGEDTDTDETSEISCVWSFNPGFAFLTDLSGLYRPDKGVPGVFDLRHNASILARHWFKPSPEGDANADNRIFHEAIQREADLSAPIIAGFDPIWLHLSEDVQLADLYWVIGLSKDQLSVKFTTLRDVGGQAVAMDSLPPVKHLIPHPALRENLKDAEQRVIRGARDQAIARLKKALDSAERERFAKSGLQMGPDGEI